MDKAELLSIAALRRARAVRNGKDGVTKVVTEVIEKPAPAARAGEPGKPGEDGVSIVDVQIEQDGAEVEFVITMSNGEVMRRQVRLPRGKDGKPGKGYDGPVLQMRAFQRAPNDLAALHFNGDGTLTATLTGGTTVTSDNSSNFAVRVVTGDTTALQTDDLIVVNSASTATVTLMPTSIRTRPLNVKRLGAGQAIVQPAGGDMIDGDPFKTINTQFTSLMLAPGWYVI